jgi:hypothetical protein
MKVLNVSDFSCLTSDAAATAAKKAAQTVVYFILLVVCELELGIEERCVDCPLRLVWGEAEGAVRCRLLFQVERPWR